MATAAHSSSALFPLLEMTHCGHSLFSFQRLEQCPICHVALSADLPSQLHESPLGTSKSFALVVKPTIGTFVDGRYQPKHTLLHVGITDGDGQVFNFDERGVHADPRWLDCISIPLSVTDDSALARWDQELLSHAEVWRSSASYHQIRNNCYDFVLHFMNAIQVDGRTNHTKDEFVIKSLGAPVDLVESYLHLHQRVIRDGHYTAKIPASSTPSVGASSLAGITVEAPASATTYTCDACGVYPLSSGDCWTCLECSNFDLCNECHAARWSDTTHLASHKMSER